VLKLDDICEALSMCIQSGSLPTGADEKLKHIANLVVFISFLVRNTSDFELRAQVLEL